MRGFRPLAVAVSFGLVAVAAPPATAGQAAPHSVPRTAVTVAWGTFRAYAPDATAVTYDPSLVPTGARVSVLGLSAQHGTMVSLALHGLLPNRAYGAHVHTRTCGRSPADSGPHFQNRLDPHQPSTDPAYANPTNEIWLDFTTDARGNAIARSTVDWQFVGRVAHSVVIHEHHTHTGSGDAGAAGARLGCLKADFR